MNVAIVLGVLDALFFGLGATIFTIGIVKNMSELTIAGIILLALSIVTTSVIYCIAPSRKQQSNPIRAQQPSSMKRNKSDTDLELMRQQEFEAATEEPIV